MIQYCGVQWVEHHLICSFALTLLFWFSFASRNFVLRRRRQSLVAEKHGTKSVTGTAASATTRGGATADAAPSAYYAAVHDTGCLATFLAWKRRQILRGTSFSMRFLHRSRSSFRRPIGKNPWTTVSVTSSSATHSFRSTLVGFPSKKFLQVDLLNACSNKIFCQADTFCLVAHRVSIRDKILWC